MDKASSQAITDRDFRENGFHVTTASKETCDVETVITEIMHRAGIPSDMSGYDYLRKSILLGFSQ